MKELSSLAIAMAMTFNMTTIFAAFSILKIDDRDFWTQVWVIIGTALFCGLIALVAAQLFGTRQHEK